MSQNIELTSLKDHPLDAIPTELLTQRFADIQFEFNRISMELAKRGIATDATVTDYDNINGCHAANLRATLWRKM